ncbi:MAG: hypothetical protein NT075_17440 [Chloroflexi bacterium]|nr:hypothetical protein [Chloroflexota bacterium]
MHNQQRYAQSQMIQDQLIKMTQAWALRRPFAAEQARQLREQALLLNHAHYLEQIPIYQQLAQEEGLGELSSIEPIKQHLMSTDDLFKSYPARWLDEGEFGQMNRWLSQIHHRRLDVDVTDVHTIDAWLQCLERIDVKLVYSSGTSGAFSFVPRDSQNWALTKRFNTCYLLPLLAYAKLGARWQQQAIAAATRLLAPDQFAAVIQKMSGARHFDGVFLDFQNGRTGMQSIGRELGPLFRRRYFLYPTELTATALRVLSRGARTEEERQQLATLQADTIGQKAQNFARIVDQMQQATAAGQQIFIFGAPFQCKELCEYMAQTNQTLTLKPGSLVLFGGGWKSFQGEKIAREALVALLAQSFGLPLERIIEGYSMTEANVFMVRCDQGRFHIPPMLEPVIFDEALSPVTGKALHGGFGFLDPLAIAYPGFIITGDVVRLIDGECACGLTGPAITEIGRAQNREIKGCAGVMASMRA